MSDNRPATLKKKQQQPGGGIRGFYLRLSSYFYGAYLATYTACIEIWQRHRKFDIIKTPKRSGEIAIVTGGARGIGLDILRKLLQLDFHVVLGIRKIEAGLESIEKIRKEGITTGTADCIELDLKSLASVRRFAETFLSKYDKVHLLYNNAGQMFVSYEITEDDIESHFQVNYLSHFLLTNLLLPTLKRTGALQERHARIINTSSITNYGGKLNFDDLQSKKLYSRHRAYYNSKLAQILHVKYLDEKLRKEGAKVHCYSFHPGMIPTSLWEHIGCLINACVPCIQTVFRTVEQGADVALYCGLSPEIENEGGLYISNSRPKRPNRLAQDTAIQEKLWGISQKLTDFDFNDITIITKK